ncbi:exodeoxyribonuclease VII large subunit [Leucobacter chinensis]|uniref:exodeoxyribonuclease VII large subunit n=1 Tax=Leucobacter chinensis TaxID=2851010 RepID=UPI001C2433AF|nr:exodeoxyribonuclease VII large subunit [Leucobacter chinensis]
MCPQPVTPASRETPWPVALMSTKVREYIDRLGTIWVEGELTQWQNRQGNTYGKLKDLDDDATISLTAWRSVTAKLTEEFSQGDRVIALVKANYWVKGGTLSFNVLDIKHVGLGDLLERLERLKAQLRSEGLFAPERKKALPFLPAKIGLITGRDSDAEKDVVRNATLRWPDVQFEIAYTAVQGERAAAEVRAALIALDDDPSVDVIIIARGGGDFQHLLPFSDEALVREAALANTPIVSAIGHEADRPLLDEVADLRASTPTDAAKRVVPDVGEERERIAQARLRLSSRLTQLITHEIDRVQSFRERPVMQNPERLIDERAEELTRWIARGAELSERQVESAERHLGELRSQLVALSPQATLNRGYAIVQNDDRTVLADPVEAPEGTGLTITLARGTLAAVAGPATSPTA